MRREVPRMVLGIAILLLVAPVARGADPPVRGHSQVHLLSPNGGEYWIAGETHQVNWSGAGLGLYSVLLYSNSSILGPWRPIASNVTSPYNWSVPNDPTNSAFVRVEVRNATHVLVGWDVSDNPFTMEMRPERTARILEPNGGERFANGSAVFVRWESDYPAGARASLRIGCAGPAGDFTTVGENLPESGIHLWAANLTGNTCYILLRVADPLTATEDITDAPFQVYEMPWVNVSSPRPGANFPAGGVLVLRWNTSGGASRLLVEILVSWKGENLTPVASGLEDPGRFELNVPWMETGNGSVRVVASDDLGNNASAEVGGINVSFATPQLGSIRGTLITPSGPVLNGRIHLYSYGEATPRLLDVTTSGADGGYLFRQLKPGQYFVDVDLQGYERTGKVVYVPPNSTSWANFTLRPVASTGPDPVSLVILGVAAATFLTGAILWEVRRRRGEEEKAAQAGK